MTQTDQFQFLEPGPLEDQELSVRLARRNPADPIKGWVPSYDFDLFVQGNIEPVGRVNFRARTTEWLEQYGGHFAYNVVPAWRGRHFAQCAVRLLLPFARLHGYRTIWITCNPDNWPSRRTCERLGATLIDIVPLPPDNVMYLEGDREKCRYRIDL